MNPPQLASLPGSGQKTLAGSPRRIVGLDALRSLAIVSVLAYHLYVFHDLGAMPKWMETALLQGWMGVDLFFVLSGFLIGSQFLRPYLLSRTPSLWHFYRDRIFRILPAYFAVLALYLFVPLWRESPFMSPAWKFITMTQNIIPDNAMARSFSHAWSLCVEMHFYFCFPIAVLLMMRKPSPKKVALLISSLLLGGISIRAFVLFHSVMPLLRARQPFGYVFMAYIYYPTYSHFEGLLVGIVLAVLMLFRPRLWSRLTAHAGYSLAAGLILLGISVWLFADKWRPATATAAVGVVLGPLVLAAALGFLLIASLGHWRFAPRTGMPGTKLIATLAYTLYLTHKEIIHLVDRAFPALFQWNRFAWIAVYICGCMACSVTLYWSVEKPFLMLRSRLRRPA